jgi:hypothetical protein
MRTENSRIEKRRTEKSRIEVQSGSKYRILKEFMMQDSLYVAGIRPEAWELKRPWTMEH